MSRWLNGLSDDDKKEMLADACGAFQADMISELEFRHTLAQLGHNATDIDDLVKFYRPSPAEGECEGD